MEEKKKENRKALLLMLFGVLVLGGVIVGATYAYFMAKAGDGAKADIDASTGTTDNLTFLVKDYDSSKDRTNVVDQNTEEKIVIDATQENFGEKGKSIGDGVTGTAHLIANNTTKLAKMPYNIYFVIDSNTLGYTTDEKKPEVLLKVTDPSGNEVTQIAGLDYHEKDKDNENDVSGFDITGKTGGYAIKQGAEIEVKAEDNGEKSDDWQIEVILVNLTSIQNDNTNKTLTAEVKLTNDTIPTIKNINVKYKTINSIAVEVETEGDTPISGYEYKIKGGSISEEQVAEDTVNTHIYNGLSENTEYTISVRAKDDQENYLVDAEPVTVTTKTKGIGDYCKNYPAACMAQNASLEPALYYHNGSDANDINDNSYRYTGGEYSIAQKYQSQFTQIDDQIIKFNCDGKDVNKYNDGPWQCPSRNGYFYVVNNPDEHFDIDKDNSSAYVFSTGYSGIGNYKPDPEYIKAANSAVEKGYLISINNYVCFDGVGKEGNCTDENNLYRIIGLFKIEDGQQYAGQYEIKVIRNSSIGDVIWDSISNQWETSYLKQELNDEEGEFYTGLSSNVKSLIVTHDWQIRGSSSPSITAKQFYKYEMGLENDSGATYPANPTTTNAKIGLMYVSDYGFAANSKYWSSYLSAYNTMTCAEDWLCMHIGYPEWTISRLSRHNQAPFSINPMGAIGQEPLFHSNEVRPSFYINPIARISAGDGSYENPYRFVI